MGTLLSEIWLQKRQTPWGACQMQPELSVFEFYSLGTGAGAGAGAGWVAVSSTAGAGIGSVVLGPDPKIASSTASAMMMAKAMSSPLADTPLER